MAGSLYLFLFLGGGAVTTIILSYGFYWALRIRHALFVGAYRSQALWIGFFSLYFIPFDLGLDSALQGSNANTALLQNLYYIVLAILLFRVVDADIRVARKSDPVLRDTIRWSRVRLIVGGLIPIGGAATMVLTWASYNGVTVTGGEQAFAQGSVYVPLLFTAVSGLLLSARRSGDPIFKRNLKWFGLFFLCYFAANFVYFLNLSGVVSITLEVLNSTQGLAFIPASYCLYRSARSLVPLNRISLD